MAVTEAKTVKIRLNQSLAGHRTRVVNAKTNQVERIGDFAHDRGDIVDWDEEEAKRLIERGIARKPTPAELSGVVA